MTHGKTGGEQMGKEGVMGVEIEKALDNSDRDVLLRRAVGQLLVMSSVPRSEADLPGDLGWGSRLQIYLQF